MKLLRGAAATLVLGIALGGCALIQGIQNPLNVTRLAQVESAYGIAVSAANGYRSLYTINRCTTAKPESFSNICARRSVVLRLQDADRKAQIALAAARTFVADNPTIDAGSVIAAASSAVAVLQQIETTNGVK